MKQMKRILSIVLAAGLFFSQAPAAAYAADAGQAAEETLSEDQAAAPSSEEESSPAEAPVPADTASEESTDSPADAQDRPADEPAPAAEEDAPAAEVPDETAAQEDPADEQLLPAEQTEDLGPAAPEAVTSTETESVALPLGDEDLFADYLGRVFGITGIETLRPRKASSKKLLASRSSGSSLEGQDAWLYTYLRARLDEILAGDRISTTFEIPLEDLGAGGSFTAEELGVEEILITDPDTGALSFNEAAISAADEKLSFDSGKILAALTADCPYELFWYDKTAPAGWSFPRHYEYSSTGTEEYLTVTGTLTITMPVAAEFSASGETGTYELSDIVSQAQNAADKAAGIVSEASSLSDYDKLVLYRDEICGLVSYNDAAAADDSTPYGNPWQLLYVFDGDPATEVVCEGYSKAFKYLCDLTSFDSSLISCILATGTMQGGTGEGPHMWNIVTMDDGLRYLVDVTNCDEGTVGAPDQLFLKGYVSVETVTAQYEAENGDTVPYETTRYGYTAGSSSDPQTIYYTYDYDTLDLYAAADLILSDTDYIVIDAEGDGHYLVFSTDRHGNTTAISEAMSAITDYAGARVEYVSMIGDMVGEGGNDAPAFNTSVVLGEIQDVFPWLTNENVSIVYGSHDKGATDDADILKCMPVGSSQEIYAKYEDSGSPAYYIYAIAYDDMINKSNSAQSLSQAFMDWCDSIEPGAPIIVLCHVPLHKKRNDNLGATYWSDALNYAATGSVDGTHVKRNVIYLHGHNHTVETTEYFLRPGASMTLQGTSKSASVQTTIRYTYITAGYLESLSTKNATLIGMEDDTITFTKFRSGAPETLDVADGYFVVPEDLYVPYGTASASISCTAYREGAEIAPDSTSYYIAQDENGILQNVEEDGTLLFTGTSGSAVVTVTCEEQGHVFSEEMTVEVAPLSGTCGEDLTWTFDPDTKILTISGTGSMASYSASSEAPWAIYGSEVHNIRIDAGVTSIGAYAFYGCKAAEHVTIPASVTAIGVNAFYGCDALTDVYYLGEDWSAVSIESGNDVLAGAQLYSETLDMAMAHSCSFGNNLSINYYVPDDFLASLGDCTNIRLQLQKQVFNEDGSSYTWSAYEKTSYTVTGDGYLRFVFSNVAAKEMGDEIRAVLLADINGTTYTSVEDVYSVSTYAYNRLEKSTNSKFKTLLVDMLNYGALAQTYFNYNTGNPVNTALTAEQQAMGTAADPELTSCEELTEMEGSTAHFYAKSVIFSSNIELKYYMTFDEGQSLDDVSLLLTYTAIDGTEHSTEIPSDDFTYNATYKAYTAKLTTVAAKDVGVTVTAQIRQGNANIGDQLAYSIETYAYNRLQKSTDENFKSLVTALMKYGFSAKAYFLQ